MYIDNLRIAQFGPLRDAEAEIPRDRLCLLGCSQDWIRDSARDFVRWMFFGNEAAATIQDLPYDHPPRQGDVAGASRGAIAITSGGRRRQIQRAADAAYGRLTIDGHYDDSTSEFRALIGRITPAEFDTIFAPLLSRDLHPDRLLSAGRLTDADLAATGIPSQRLRQLQDRHRYLRDELDHLPVCEMVHLTQRRSYLRRRLDELNQQIETRRREFERQYHELCQKCSAARQDVDRLKSDHRLRADEANRRRDEVEEAWRVAQQAKDAYLRGCREELTELENRSNRWRGILQEVRTRLAEVERTRHSDNSHQSTCLVAGLAEKLDRLRRDMDAWYDPVFTNLGSDAQPYDFQCHVEHRDTYPLVNRISILSELRREVSRLCHTLQTQSTSNKDRWLENEADFLHQCESLVNHWLAKLDEQRHTAQRHLSEVERLGLTLIDGSFESRADHGEGDDPARYYRTTTYDVGSNYIDSDYSTSRFETGNHTTDPTYGQSYTSYHSHPYVAGYIDWDGSYVRNYPLADDDPYRTDLFRTDTRTSSSIHLGHVQAVPHSCAGYDVVHPDTDQRLRQLIDSRNGIQRELEARQRELGSLELQRDSIDERRRQVDDFEIQSTRRELSELEERFHTANQRAQIEREIDQVVDQMSREQHQPRNPAVLEDASRILGQLTGGRFNRVRIENRHHVAVDDARGTSVNLIRCRELRADTFLALCLAMVAEYHRRGIELPLILSEPFVLANHGHDRTRARVLADFAAAGHQVIVLSCQHHTRDLFRAGDHVFVELQPRPSVRPLAPPLPRVNDPPLVAEPPASPPPQPELEDQVRFKRRTAATDKSRVQTEYETGLGGPGSSQDRHNRQSATEEDSVAHIVTPILDPVVSRNSPDPIQKAFSDERHSLSLNSPIEATQVIDPQVAVWLREKGVDSVRAFLELASADVIQVMASDGLDPVPIRRWQDELALRCWVVGLAAEDAALLISCGIQDAEQLAEIDTDELYDFVLRKLKTRSDATYDARRLERLREQVGFWGRAARRSRTDWIRFRTRSFAKRAWSRNSTETTRAARPKSSRRASSARSSRRREKGIRKSSATRSSESKHDAQVSRSSRSSQSQAASVTEATDRSTKLRFHLSSSDPLVDAPSIGARTAEHFYKIGVKNVAEFINLNPDTAADQIDNRRISAKTIGQWQAQAVLACRIPELRGHDAQILVACDVKDPTTLARMEPSELWARVQPFVKTAEGKRILRGGKKPNLQEIQDWISWAKHSRTLRAA